MTESNKTLVGIGFCGLLALVFITLRLTKVIDWPWGWVLLPIGIPGVVLLAIGIYMLFDGLIWIIQARKSKRKLKRGENTWRNH
jgi:uncharacterized membrane protein